jgi:GNAT superfamily N-acetyltransferase
VHIRECRARDLPLLEASRPVPGAASGYARRYERQRRGLSSYLIAWLDGQPTGMGEVLWPGCAAPEVQQRFAGCPELNGLEVWPAARRSHGIGTAIIRAAEDSARQHGCRLLGLGVYDDNPRAAALYLRLGYQDQGCRYLDRYYYLDGRGVRHDVTEPARFLVKALGAAPHQAAPGPPPRPRTPGTPRPRR